VQIYAKFKEIIHKFKFLSIKYLNNMQLCSIIMQSQSAPEGAQGKLLFKKWKTGNCRLCGGKRKI